MHRSAGSVVEAIGHPTTKFVHVPSHIAIFVGARTSNKHFPPKKYFVLAYLFSSSRSCASLNRICSKIKLPTFHGCTDMLHSFEVKSMLFTLLARDKINLLSKFCYQGKLFYLINPVCNILK